ncbi:MAG TPA: hypothetical protein VGP72_00235 [Planctomycetota bacterium]|jgi:hypothetical protein
MEQKKSPIHPRKVLFAASVLLAIGAGSAGIYLTDKLYLEPLRQQQRLIGNLKLIVEQLTKDVRLAEVAVLDQTPERTKFKFVEVNDKNEAIAEPKVFEVEGDEVYFDTLVIKFEDKFKPLDKLPIDQKELSENLLGKSIMIFRRVFSSKQKPEEGFPLDIPGDAPEVYRPSVPQTAFEKQLWKEFWTLVNDPKLAKDRGVRAAHGQAVSIKLKKGKYYVLERRLAGDLTIRPVDVPAVMR